MLVGVKYSTACENTGTSVQLRCEANTKILVNKAEYGRDEFTTACGDFLHDTSCFSDVTEIVKNQCGNMQNCDIKASNGVFPDPCVGYTKLLRVWYQCVGDGIFYLHSKFIIVIKYKLIFKL